VIASAAGKYASGHRRVRIHIGVIYTEGHTTQMMLELLVLPVAVRLTHHVALECEVRAWLIPTLDADQKIGFGARIGIVLP
jgi:hypothetical protein